MARRTTTNIGNRQLDISFIDYDSQDGNSIGFNNAKMITGVYKLAQKFAHILLTPIGSDLTDPTYGTNLVSLTSYNIIKNMDALVMIYVSEASEQLVRYQDEVGAEVENLDERLLRAKLEDFTSTLDTINLSVRITSESGDDLLIIIPYSRS